VSAKLKVAILGTGFMGRTHAQCWARVPEAKIAAFLETPERAKEAAPLALRYGAKIVTNYEDILKDKEINIIDICLPTFLHKDFAIKAMEAGKHVLCEKPIALTLKDAKEMIDTARKTGVKFMVAMVVRFFPEYKATKELVDQGALGEPRIARAYRIGTFPVWGVKGWFGEQKLSGGVIVDLAIHDLDYLRWLFNDEVDRVYALSPERKVVKDITAQDHAIILLKFKKGTIAYCMASWAYPPSKKFTTYFEVVGTEGILIVDNLSTAPLKVWTKEGETFLQPVPKDGYQLEIEHFAECVLKDKEPLVKPEDAYKALEIALAAVKSTYTGKPVSLPLPVEEVIL